MNKPQRNHNPGNLIYAKQREAVGVDDKGFAVFQDDPAGWRALVNQIDLDQRRNLTIRQFIEKYAPCHENDTAAYLDFVAHGLAGHPEDTLGFYSKYAIAGLIAAREGYMVKGV